MIKLKNILLEDEDFGDWVFADTSRLPHKSDRFIKYQNGEREPNTDLETDLLYALDDWVKGSSEETAQKLYDKKELCQAAKLTHPKIFKPTLRNGEYVYRGLSTGFLTREEFWNSTNDTEWEDINLVNGKRIKKYTKTFRYIPHRLIQSWSSSKTNTITKESFGSIMLRTKIDDDFIFNHNVFGILYSGKSEYETLHFGKEYKNEVELLITQEKFNVIRKLTQQYDN